MKRILFASILCSFVCAIAMAQPTTQPSQQRGRGGRGPRDPSMMPQNVEAAMKGANRAMKTLKQQIKDASKKDENLKLIGDMQRNIVIAKNMPLPHDIREDVEGEARVKLQLDYRADLIAIVRKLLDMEENVMSGKLDGAEKQLDELQKMRETAHEKLGVHDDDDRK